MTDPTQDLVIFLGQQLNIGSYWIKAFYYFLGLRLGLFYWLDTFLKNK